MDPRVYANDGVLWLEKGIPLSFDMEKLTKWIERGRRLVTYLMFGMTYQCQCNCRHCCTGNYVREKNRELTTEEVKNVIDQVGTPLIVNFFGGEPTLRPDLMELVKYASKRAVFVFLDTNGIRITKDYAQQLKDNGLELLYVSIDSPVPEKHDEYRGYKGCYEKAVNAVKNALDVGLKVVLSTYVTKENLSNGEFERVIQMAREIGATGVRYLLPTPAGRWLHNLNVRLTPEERKRVKELVDFPFVYREFYFQPQATNHCRGVANREYAYVSPYGDVQPCCFIPLTFGNIREEPLKVILERMWSHPMYSEKCLSEECPMQSDEFRRKYIDTIPSDVKLPYSL
ncbi:MAG: radical SAM protein [Candidatus Jordarchaeaceae archaeon]